MDEFAGLTQAQQMLILHEGWRVGQTYPDGKPWPKPSAKTVRELFNRGLIHKVTVQLVDGKTVTEYHVPLGVHLDFCTSAAELDEDDDSDPQEASHG